MPAFSSRLSRILQLRVNTDATFELQSLAESMIRELPAHRGSLRQLLSCFGTRSQGWLCKTLMLVAENDSKVRDFISTGHLGKLLARLPYVEKNVKLIGLPNVLFDRISLEERALFFAEHFHEFDADVASSPLAQEILIAEKGISSRSEDE